MSVATMIETRNEDQRRLTELGIERCPMCGQLDLSTSLNSAGCSQCAHRCEGCQTVDVSADVRTCRDCRVCPGCDKARTNDDFVGRLCWSCSQEGPSASASVLAMGMAA